MTNEILFFIIAIVALCLVLVAFRFGTHWLVGLIVAYLLIGNLFAPKLSVIFGVTSSLAIPLYAAIFLATDILAEHFGSPTARKAVWIGFLAQVCMLVFGQLIVRGEAFGDPRVADALSVIFGFMPRIVIGSFIAYLISQNFDVAFFDFLKRAFSSKFLWLRNCLSTVMSQGLDTFVFVMIAFYGKVPNIYEFILTVWIVKVGVALLDTPFIYLSYWVAEKYHKSANENAKSRVSMNG